MDKLSKEQAVNWWIYHSFLHFVAGKALEEIDDVSPINSHFEPYFCYMGIELLCKAFIIAENSASFSSLEFEKAKTKIDEIAKDISHKIEKVIKKIGIDNPNCDIPSILKTKYDNLSGEEALTCLEAAYIETRYPVPIGIHKKFPLTINIYHDPLNCSAIIDFSYALGRALLFLIKEKHHIFFDETIMGNSVLSSGQWRRFVNLFFVSKSSDYFKSDVQRQYIEKPIKHPRYKSGDVIKISRKP
ncbi:MAG: hypothetical protein PHW04_12885 [Candidatus Wallbacteria bacterium]|nr:hypothetical protein [Candidatus Wallbacteria bacterium]